MTEIRTKEEIECGIVTKTLLDTMFTDWSDRETARFLGNRLRRLESDTRANFIESGMICMEVSERELWKEDYDPETGEAYTSFNEWIARCAPVSRSSCFEAMGVIRSNPQLTPDRLMDIPRTNLRLLSKLSTKVKSDPEVIKKAKELGEKQFVAEIRRDFPDQHFEDSDKLWFSMTKTAGKVVLDAIQVSMRVDECTTREEALEAICTEYLNTNGWPE